MLLFLRSPVVRRDVALFLISLVLALALCSIPILADDSGAYTIQSKVSEVRLAFSASDRQGHAIRSLRSSDVAVVDNQWVIRQFRSFQPSPPSSLDLVLLLDVSRSMESHLGAEIAEAKEFIENSGWEPHDSMSILVFGGAHPQLLCARNCREGGELGKLNALRADGTTPLYDALLAASEILQEEKTNPESRAAMILLSDGVDTASERSLAEALHAAQRAEAPIYVASPRGRNEAGSGHDVLGFMASSTGGLSFGPGQKLKNILPLVLEDLRSGYVLTYALPEPKSGEHAVRILATRDASLYFRSRRSYEADSRE